MLRIVFLIAFGAGIHASGISQSFDIPDNVKRIVFLGNSITYQGKYVEYIDAWFLGNYKNLSEIGIKLDLSYPK